MAIESTRVTAILLAAGRSSRFGENKLLQPLAGEPLAHHSAKALAAMPFARRIAVVGEIPLKVERFGFVPVKAPAGAPLSISIATGVAAAEEIDCDACLIALADMPLIPTAHFRTLLTAHRGDATATAALGRNMVPALFARKLFYNLRHLAGDRGAFHLLLEANTVDADPDWIADIDTPDQLAVVQDRM